MERKRILSVILGLLVLTSAATAERSVQIGIALHGNIPERFFDHTIPQYNNKNGGFGVGLLAQARLAGAFWLETAAEYSVVTEDYQTDNIGTFGIISIVPVVQYNPGGDIVSPLAGAGVGLYHVLYHSPVLVPGVRLTIGGALCGVLTLRMDYNRLLADIPVDPDVRGEFDNYYVAVKLSVLVPIGSGSR